MQKHMADEQLHERLVARIMNRRRFLRSAGVGGLAAGAVAASYVHAAPSNPPVPGNAALSSQRTQGGSSAAQGGSQSDDGYEFFTPFQADIIIAAAARIVPTDENGPGATEAGVVHFIDRQLSSDYGMTGRRYLRGPFAAGAPTQGDQSGLDVRDRYRLGIQAMERIAQELYQQGFAACSPEQQDRILSDMQAGRSHTFVHVSAAAFFALLLQHVVAGLFADPVHGGNRGMVGWQLIDFPGAQVSYAAHISNYGQPWTGGYKSLAEYQDPFRTHHG
jgi:gluconate 2-dehydrogenase gamma chain